MTAPGLVPVAGMEDVLADPASARLLEGRLERGEVTPDELRAILRGEHNARPNSEQPRG
jgi:hypothetical protein